MMQRELKEPSHVIEPEAPSLVGDANQPDPPYKCSRHELEGALAVVEGKWKAFIVCELVVRNMRFRELEKLLGDISRRILTYELRFLEKQGIVQRSFTETDTRRVEYSLTPRGRALNGVLVELASWARRVDAV
jgi:DNA-binding HxlR family transcriptional regulator